LTAVETTDRISGGFITANHAEIGGIMQCRVALGRPSVSWLLMVVAGCLGLAGIGLASLPAQAQTATAWPTRAIRLVVPFPPGGATDLVARVLAQRVSQDIGQPVIVDNKAGAGGTIGATEVAKGTADGYVLLMATSSTHAIAPHLNRNLAYDAIKDFTAVAHIADAAHVLLVTPSLPAHSVAELIAHAKLNPDKLNFASSGNGTIVHLTAEAFKAQAGVAMTHVPYKGTALAMPDVMSGAVHVIFDLIPSGMPHVKAGRLRALAVTGDKRSVLAPELPTVAETGLAGFSSVSWFGVFAPPGLPLDLVDKLNAAFDKALRSPDVTDAFAKNGVEPAPSASAETFSKLVAGDSEKWGRLIREQKITLE
jgi:tripartite-type tricarboxylate transporter receptor subunit TctC